MKEALYLLKKCLIIWCLFSHDKYDPLNSGTNDEEDFPQSFLLGIYDRINQKEFETGNDHTQQVLEIRKQIIGHGIPVSRASSNILVY